MPDYVLFVDMNIHEIQFIGRLAGIHLYAEELLSDPRLDNYSNGLLVKTPGIIHPYYPVLLGHFTGCN